MPNTSSRWILCLALLAAHPAAAQKARKYKAEYWSRDPYTQNDPAVMKAAGYVSFGPFAWGDDHDTAAIRKMFPTRKILFLETRHFKIACNLGEYRLPKVAKLEKKILKAELTRLKKVFPKIKPNLRRLDPWLRLHLFALRLEDTYRDFSERLQVTDADFPEPVEPGAAPRFDKKKREEWMGTGPYLGMRAKYTVMLMTKAADLNRYVAKVRGNLQPTSKPMPQRFYARKTGSLFFGVACECADNALFNDHALHCNVVFSTTHSLVEGYKDFYFQTPVWVREGLGHWFLRRIDPKEHIFSGMKGRDHLKRYDPRWEPKIKKRVRNDDFTPAARLMKMMSFHDLTFGDHMAAWSRIDFLMKEKKKFAAFMGAFKNRIGVSHLVPTPEQVIAQQESALKAAYGYDFAAFDAAWASHVRKTYPNR